MAYEQSTTAQSNGHVATVGTSSSQGVVQRRIDAAIRSVLGKVPRRDDPQGFLAVLNQSFAEHPQNGKATMPGMMPATPMLSDDHTVAEARLQQRAYEAQRAVPALLSRIQPLKINPDTRQVEAIRRITQAAFDELFDELRDVSEPNVERIDNVFDRLDKALGRMNDAFELTNGEINTTDDRQQQADFLAIRDDYFGMLRTRWDELQAGTDYDTQVAKLRRTLGIISQLVPEVEQAMDDTCLGAARREIITVGSGPNDPSIKDVFEWIGDLATNEGPRLIHDGGRRGVEGLVGPLQSLHSHVEALETQIKADPSLTEQLKESCVLLELGSLRQQLGDAKDVAQAVVDPVAQTVIDSAEIDQKVLQHTLHGPAAQATGKVRFAGGASSATLPAGLKAEFAYGDLYTDPTTWKWQAVSNTSFQQQADGSFKVKSDLYPDTSGVFNYLMRVSLDGTNWLYGQIGGSRRGDRMADQICKPGVLIVNDQPSQVGVSASKQKMP